MRTLPILAALLLFAGIASADSIDDAEAKRRGVPVEQVQLENARAYNAYLLQEVADLQAKVAALEAHAPKAVLPTTSPAAPATAIAATPSAHVPATATPGDGSVEVKGYYRKDGTYVAPYTRAAPRSK